MPAQMQTQPDSIALHGFTFELVLLSPATLPPLLCKLDIFSVCQTTFALPCTVMLTPLGNAGAGQSGSGSWRRLLPSFLGSMWSSAATPQQESAATEEQQHMLVSPRAAATPTQQTAASDPQVLALPQQQQQQQSQNDIASQQPASTHAEAATPCKGSLSCSCRSATTEYCSSSKLLVLHKASEAFEWRSYRTVRLHNMLKLHAKVA